MIEVVRYRPGVPIDTSKILEIIGLPAAQWGPIEAMYPEIQVAGPTALFRREPNVTIFPPSYVSPKMIKMLLGVGDEMHTVYRLPAGESNPASVMVHVVGGYASIHIYRLRPPMRRNRPR